jgi:hypothetical protein
MVEDLGSEFEYKWKLYYLSMDRLQQQWFVWVERMG